MHDMPRYLPCSSKYCASALFTLAEYIRLEEKDEKRRDLLMQAFELKTLIILIDGIDEVRAYVVSASIRVCVYPAVWPLAVTSHRALCSVSCFSVPARLRLSRR